MGAEPVVGGVEVADHGHACGLHLLAGSYDLVLFDADRLGGGIAPVRDAVKIGDVPQ
jgi:hypothetical protein